MINFIFTYLPFFISFLLGYFLILLLKSDEDKINNGIHIFLAAGLGLGISSQTNFISLLIFNQVQQAFVITFNLFILLGLFFLCFNQSKIKLKLPNFKDIKWLDLLPYAILILCSIPLWRHANIYAYGGWDAWSTWNLKAKIIFLSGENWQSIFNPILWRSSPHYPLQQPLTNVWGWIFLKDPHFNVPIFSTYLITMLTIGLLFSTLKKITKSYIAIIPGVILLSNPLFIKQSLSQYADNMVGYYLLAGLICLLFTKRNNSSTYSILSGLSLGFLGFTKNEGFAAMVFISALAIPYLFWKNKPNKKIIVYFLSSLFFASLSTIIFKIGFAPENTTSINGLTSTIKPSSLMRLKATLGFYAVEMLTLTSKWNGIWLALILGLLLSIARAFNRYLIIFPAFILIYSIVIIFYYYTNTYFEILWWLQVSLHRLVYAVLPTTIFWIYYSLWYEKEV